MKAVLFAALVLLPLVLVPAAEAGIQWLPVCKDKDVRAGEVVHAHVGVDCYPGVWVDVCVPDQGCTRVDLTPRA